eukprot:250316-Rhodomonas_salina.1
MELRKAFADTRNTHLHPCPVVAPCTCNAHKDSPRHTVSSCCGMPGKQQHVAWQGGVGWRRVDGLQSSFVCAYAVPMGCKLTYLWAASS